MASYEEITALLGGWEGFRIVNVPRDGAPGGPRRAGPWAGRARKVEGRRQRRVAA